MDALTPLDRAIEVAGGETKLARVLGVTPAAVTNWKRGGIPPARIGHIAALTGLTPHEIAPELFPTPQPASAAP